jgi:hypothetical protein
MIISYDLFSYPWPQLPIHTPMVDCHAVGRCIWAFIINTWWLIVTYAWWCYTTYHPPPSPLTLLTLKAVNVDCVCHHSRRLYSCHLFLLIILYVRPLLIPMTHNYPSKHRWLIVTWWYYTNRSAIQIVDCIHATMNPVDVCAWVSKN